MSSRAEALRHVDRGWPTLPVYGKKPASRLIRATRGTPGWIQLAKRPAGADEVCAWNELDPCAGIGVITGRSSNLVVVDVDSDTEPFEIPTTATASSGRGHHYYFTHTNPPRTRKFKWGEIRGEGSYTVAPDSRHPSGAT
jgi:hypothetical protein